MSPFRPRVALASLSGRSDASWASAVAEHVGAAFLGGIAIDDPTRAAARQLADRDRTEFLPTDPVDFIDRQLRALAPVSLRPGMNVRAVSPERLAAAARVCARHDAILELNAHCRQAEMCAAGGGEALLADTERSRELVESAASTGATVSVKVRTEVAGVDLPSLAAELEAAGADIIHIDAMDSEHAVTTVVDRLSTTAVIANNGVRDRSTTHEYLDYGADAVSVGRASDDPTVLGTVRRATGEWFVEQTGTNGGEWDPGPTEA